MSKTLERYQRCSYGTMEANHQDQDEQSSYQEYLKLKAKVDILQRSHRHYLGEELEPLGSKELDQLERQLDSSLRQVRSTKTQRMLDQLSQLQHKLEESTTAYQLSREAHERKFENRPLSTQQEGYFQHPNCNDNRQIGYYNEAPNDEMEVASTSQNANGVIPGWML